MTSIITSISLDPETLKIRDQYIANYGFSKWIRESLRRYAAAHGPQTHTHPVEQRVRGLCNGMRNPACVICWPQGSPSVDDWAMWRLGKLEKRPEPRVPYFALPDADPEDKRKKTPPKVKRGLIRRLWAWLY